MHFVVIALFMFVLPAGCVALEYAVLHTSTDLILLIGKWFAFWGVGMRLGIAGLRQAFNPAFTAQDIFEIEDPRVQPIVRELGFANLSLALLGLLAIVPGWPLPAAISGGLFFALAGWKHMNAKDKNLTRTVAMVSDLFITAVLAVFVAISVMRLLA